MIRGSNLLNLFSWGPMYLIGLPIVFLLPFWLIGFIYAGRAEKITGVRPKNWVFLTASLIFGFVLYLVISDLVRIGLEQIFPNEAGIYSFSRNYSYDRLIKNLSARMVIVLLGLPLFATFWYKATQKSALELEEKSETFIRKYFLTLEVTVLGIITLFSLGTCLYNLFNNLLGVSESSWPSYPVIIAYGGTAIVILIFKLFALKSLKK